MVTTGFLKKVLSGQKRLLRHAELKPATYVPRFYEINVREIWNEVKGREDIQPYFPDSFVTMKRVPERPYLFAVCSKGVGDQTPGAIQVDDQAGDGKKAPGDSRGAEGRAHQRVPRPARGQQGSADEGSWAHQVTRPRTSASSRSGLCHEILTSGEQSPRSSSCRPHGRRARRK